MKLLCVTGKKGSGKSIATKVASEMGIRFLEMHEPVYEKMQAEGIPLTHDNIITYAEGLRKGKDFAIVAKLMLAKIKKQKMKDKLMLICGIRHPDEVAEFRKHCPVFFIAIDADAKIRFGRIRARAEKWDSRTFEEFVKKEQSESAGLGMDKAMASADATISNNGKMEELEQRLRNLLLFAKG
jgi:dephospho-CoA kinase